MTLFESESMQLLPDDYRIEVDHELIDFFHTFLRFGNSSYNQFNLDNPHYLQLFHSITLCAMGIGTLVFMLLCILVIRRCFLDMQEPAILRYRNLPRNRSAEIYAALMLSFIAIYTLSGLMREAQVDYAAGVVKDSMLNTSSEFSSIKMDGDVIQHSASLLRQKADLLVVSFNETILPPEVFSLSIGSSRLLHDTNKLVDTLQLSPKNVTEMALGWEQNYVMLKGTTAFVILAIVFSALLSVASLGWSMLSPLRLSIMTMMIMVPVSHTLMGVYLSSTMLTADFCVNQSANTLQLFSNSTATVYFLECSNHSTNPFADVTQNMLQSLDKVVTIEASVAKYAKNHQESGAYMIKEFLKPMEDAMEAIKYVTVSFKRKQNCQQVLKYRVHATETVCEYGISGFFSMWVHQIILCALLCIGVVITVLVYERVMRRERAIHSNYRLLSSYEEDDTEHMYLSPE